MRGFFVAGCRPSHGDWGCRSRQVAVLVVLWIVHAAPLVSAERMPSSSAELPGLMPVKQSDPSSAARPVAIADVVLQTRGVLHGVVRSGTKDSGRSVAGVRVVLARDGRMVAESKSDRFGRFRFSGLRGGVHVLAVVGERGVELNLCRVWAEGASPPKASDVAQVTLGEGIVRGQGPLPSVKFSEAALMAGVVVGAVAAPIIYHNAQKSNRVPASP